VFFIDASHEYSEGKNQNKLREQDLEKIVATWRARREVAKYAHIAAPDELKENDYNLNIPLYVDTFEEESPIDLEEVKAAITKLEAKLAATRADLAKALQELDV
jgi:type I restriction enzyme M protein